MVCYKKIELQKMTKRKLIKGTYSFSREEPFNEWLSFNIRNRLGFNYCYYQIEFNDKTKFISKYVCLIQIYR